MQKIAKLVKLQITTKPYRIITNPHHHRLFLKMAECGIMVYSFYYQILKRASMNVLTLTDNAANKLAKLKSAEGNDKLMLRIYVTGGGCSGFSYGFDFAEELDEDDATFLNGDATLVVDSLSYQYLHGSTIDYVEGLEGSRFVVDNPNATTTCGCGSSFSI